MMLAGYFGAKYGWDPETIGVVSGMIGVATTAIVYVVRERAPELINLAESATGLDLDNDGDVGK